MPVFGDCVLSLRGCCSGLRGRPLYIHGLGSEALGARVNMWTLKKDGASFIVEIIWSQFRTLSVKEAVNFLAPMFLSGGHLLPMSEGGIKIDCRALVKEGLSLVF